MQIFIPYSDPKQVAMVLDVVRLHKQILEADYIIDCIVKYRETGDVRFLRHPVMKMYKDHLDWLCYYREVLNRYRIYHSDLAWLDLVEPDRPLFLYYTPLLDCHKKRLFQKGKKDQARRHLATNHYAIFAPFDSANEDNLYIVDNIIYRYNNGKCLSMQQFIHKDLNPADFEDLSTSYSGDVQKLDAYLFNHEMGVPTKDS